MRHQVRKGFTLIELLTAVGLGLVIVYTAFAGLRVASHGVAVANRLSLENGLMRTGYLAALEEKDHWLLYDDPEAAAGQRLRGFDQARGRGLPFTPFPDRFPRVDDASQPERDRGWDPDYVWPANDSRVWFHGNVMERAIATDRYAGHYELFTHLRDEPLLDRSYPVGVAWAGTTTPEHTWYPNQLQGLRNVLGYYGAIDYLPSGAIYTLYGDPGPDNRFGTGDDRPDQQIPREYAKADYASVNYFQFNCDDDDCQIARSLYRNTKEYQFGIVPGTVWTDSAGLDVPGLVRANSAMYKLGQFASEPDVVLFFKRALQDVPLLRTRPSHWPDLRIGVCRAITFGRFVNLSKVRWTSPITGETVELSFTSVGTTLRGARQQRPMPSDPSRNLDGGAYEP